MAIAGKKALVKVSGSAVAFTNEPTTADETLKVFQITDQTKRVWDRKSNITVEESTDNGTTWSAASGYSLDRLAGKVIFATAQAAGTQIRVSGSYLPLSIAAECKEYSYSLQGDNQDASSFGADFIKRKQGLKDISGSLSQWYVDTYFKDALTSGEPIVLEIYADSSANYDFRVWALLAKDEISSAVDGLIEAKVEFEGTADIDGRVISNG